MEDPTYEEVLQSPNKFGMPTFEDFKLNHERYMGRDDDKLAFADKGSDILKRHVKKHIYELEGYRCESLEEVERVASSQGIPLRDLDYRPQLIPLGGGKCDILIKFVSKDERAKREGIDAGEQQGS